MTTILVTGASSGIGLATALRFARAGHDVVAAIRNPAAAPPELRQANVAIVRMDVNDDASVAEAVAQVPCVDVLVNNAGIGAGGPIELTPLQTARDVFETNYFGAIRVTQAVLPGMRARRSGTIINVTSVAGRFVAGAHGHYCASKFALEAASEALAYEVRPFGIRVAIVEPGVILTPIFGKHKVDMAAMAPYEAPVRRLLQFFESQLENPRGPEIVAEAIERAAFTTEPKLRYLVGPDAEMLVRARSAATDEEWLEDVTVADDAEYARRLNARFRGGA